MDLIIPGGGCNKALFAFGTSVEYFQNNNSRVYVASLDLSKAFDRINHYDLLTLLMKGGMPLFLINILFSWLSKSSGTVVWNNCLSYKFDIFSGVQEGSIIGSKLFNCKRDEILNALETSYLGFFLNSSYLGAFAYVDDLLLLSSSLSMLSFMIYCSIRPRLFVVFLVCTLLNILNVLVWLVSQYIGLINCYI